MRTTHPTISTIVLLMVTFIITDLHAQGIGTDSTRNYIKKLITSEAQSDKVILSQKLEELAASPIEKEMDIAVNSYNQLGNQRKTDSLLQAEIIKFPQGFRSRGKAVEEIYQLKTGAEKEIAYNKWIKNFPLSKFEDEPLTNDYIAQAIASQYAAEKNTAKAIEFAGKLKVDFWMGSGYGGIAQAFYQHGDLENAAIFYKKAIEHAKVYYEGKLPNENSSKFAASGYPGLLGSYASVLYDQKKYPEALNYAEQVARTPSGISPRAKFQYGKILMALNRDTEAFVMLEDAVKSGKANAEMSTLFKDLYIKTKGSNKGFEQYAAQIRKGVLTALQQKLSKEMLKKHAADFTLTDLDGKKVSLSDLKGKVVILDFWATWCGPCKASFPAMQMAVNKYKDDPSVKFLFIHTWEKTATPLKDAADYIKSQKYNFEVLMDTKDPETKVNNVVTSYKVNGIPSKFVIDPSGDIRFHLMGFDGSNEAALDEISIMIDMAKKG